MYILLKGTLKNFLVSLKDSTSRNSTVIRKYNPGTLIWGLRSKNKLVSRGVKAFLYINKTKDFDGGIVLEGEIIDVNELKERYWPEGDWNYYVAMKLLFVPKSILQNDIKSWKYITLSDLAELGLKVLPGVQKVEESVGAKLEKLLKEMA